MHGRLDGDTVHLDGNARERFYDSRGYGRPGDDGGLDLAPVEAAHLLERGDIDDVDGLGTAEFVAATGTALELVVYRDLRDRGFYLSPAREGWVDSPGSADLVVYPRGQGPWDDDVAHQVRTLGEREPLPAADLGEVTLAIVDEDGELTYFETTALDPEGEAESEPPAAVGQLLADRVLVPDPPSALHESGFYGQRFRGRGADAGPLQLSLVEAAHLRRRDVLSLADGADGNGGHDTLLERGRAVEGERFDRRLATYAALRERGLVPKSGFKFGADFRVYADFESVSELGHSEFLVWALPPDHVFSPRELSLDVRLAAGVRKRTIFALTDASADTDTGSGIRWLSVERLTP